MAPHDTSLFKNLGDMKFSQIKPEILPKEEGDYRMIYDPQEHTLDTVKGTEQFYCGEEVTDLAVLLIDFREGNLTLQETYTLLGIALGSEKVNNIY